MKCLAELIDDCFESRTGESVFAITSKSHVDMLNWVSLRVDYFTGLIGTSSNWTDKHAITEIDGLVKQYLELNEHAIEKRKEKN